MKFSTLVVLCLVALSAVAQASPKVKAKKTVKVIKPSNLSTNINFSGTGVDGKYKVPGEAVATVENEKSLIDLIEPRREFKDRLRKSVTQR